MRQDVSMETLLDHTKILPKVRQPPSPLDFNFKHVSNWLLNKTLNYHLLLIRFH